MCRQTLAKLPYFNFVEILQQLEVNTSGEMNTQTGVVNLIEAFLISVFVSLKNEIV
jgi:hypothetical protein